MTMADGATAIEEFTPRYLAEVARIAAVAQSIEDEDERYERIYEEVAESAILTDATVLLVALVSPLYDDETEEVGQAWATEGVNGAAWRAARQAMEADVLARGEGE